VIRSVFDNQVSLVCAIAELHLQSARFDLDPVFGNGLIHNGLGRPDLTFDIEPKDPLTKEADCRWLPIESESVNSVMFDPPFLAGGGTTGKMHDRYSSFSNWRELLAFYDASIFEMYRVLNTKGVLVFKCQDLMNGRTQIFSHCEIYKMALELGFYAKDLFILESRRLMRPHNMKNQLHARKSHTYFWVFENSGKNNGIWAPGPQGV